MKLSRGTPKKKISMYIYATLFMVNNGFNETKIISQCKGNYTVKGMRTQEKRDIREQSECKISR